MTRARSIRGVRGAPIRRRRPGSVWLGLATCLAVLLSLAHPVAAAPARVAVYVEGVGAAEIREVVVSLLPEATSEVIEPQAFTLAMRQSGSPPVLGVAISAPQYRSQLLTLVRRALTKAEADGVVLGRAVRTAQGLRLAIVYVEREPGTPRIDALVTLEGDDEMRRGTIADALRPLLDELAPPPPPPPPPSVGDDDDDDDDDEPGAYVPHRAGFDVFSVEAGFELGFRGFSYTESEVNTQNLRPYSVAGAPAIAVGAEIYPAATTGIVVLEDVGVTFSYMHAFGLASQVQASSQIFDNTYNRLRAGLRYRFRLGDEDRPVVLGLSGTFGLLNFTFDPQDPAAQAIAGEVATARYTFLRAGVDARVPLVEWLALGGGFSYVGPLDAGDVYDRFDSDALPRDASVGGIDAHLTVIAVLPEGFELRLLGEYTRFFYAFAPEPGDVYIAGGALDQLGGLRLSAAYRY